MNVLVTGGAGFIGSHVGEALLADGHQVVCLDRFDPFYSPALKRLNIAAHRKHSGYALVEGDIRDEQLLRQVFGRYGCDTVIHLAARAGVRPSLQDPAGYVDVNVTGTARVLEAARAQGVSHLLFASSSSVYGASASVPFREDQPVDQPLSPYGASKVAGELLCQTYHRLYGLGITALRFFTVYGPRQRPDLAIAKFTRAILRGQSIPVYGTGQSQRDYTYIDDIVAGIKRALTLPEGSWQVVNLGSDRPVLLSELIALLERAIGQPAVPEHLPPQSGDLPATWADLTKARSLLGYAPQVSIEDGLARYLRWCREEGREWLERVES